MDLAGVELIGLKVVGTDSDQGRIVKVVEDISRDIPVREVYISEVNPGVIKGWKCHSSMYCRLTVMKGRLIFNLSDNERVGLRRVEMHDRAPKMLIIPPGIWFAFYNPNQDVSSVLNFASALHDPTEAVNISSAEFPLSFQK